MFKYLRYGVPILGLLFAAGMAQAEESEIKLCASHGTQACDVVFSAIPTFEPPPICVLDIDTFQFTITNTTPASIGIDFIRIQNNDGLPDAEVTIGTAPTNNCVSGTSLAGGASCNILVSVQPLVLGMVNRVLQIGLDSTQPTLQSPIVFNVACTPPPPPPGTLDTIVYGPPVGGPPLSTTLNCSVLGATPVVSNTGVSNVNGNVCISPAASITGFFDNAPPGPGLITNGSSQLNTGIAITAQNALTTIVDPYIDGLACTTTLAQTDLGGLVLTPGVYCLPNVATIGLTGALTLNGPGFYYFQIPNAITTASASSVVLIGGATSAKVFWNVGSAATLGTTTIFKGTILAGTSITLNTGASVAGRVLAETGAVTLDTNAVNPLAP